MKLIFIILSCIVTCRGRPQDILFETLTNECGQNKVDVKGTCYLKGEQGPCKPGQFIWATEEHLEPVCIDKDTPGSLSSSLVVPSYPDCDHDSILWGDGNCYQLNSQGPCDEGSWLLLESVEGEEALMKCQVRKCQEEDAWWPETCSCKKLGSLDVCGQDEAVAVGPYGEGICASTLGDRILDLIPTNEDSQVQSRTSSRTCHVDQNGICRRTLEIKNLRERGNFETFVNWLGGFSKRTVENCIPVPQCDNDTLPWVDGHCYQLTTQGPCDDGSWLVLKNNEEGESAMKCEARRCKEEETWWPETCSCVEHGSSDECGEDEAIATGPYGEGICTSTLGVRILDLIPTNEDDEVVASQRRRSRTRSCHIDENGRCRRTLKIRNLRRRGGFEDWLGEFSQRTTTDESGDCIPALQCEGDSLPWNDGNCYQLASRGPCDVGSWLVLEEIVDGEKPVMKCQQQRCEDTGVWWPETCSCVGLGRSDVCGDGQGIAVGPYGEGVCANMLGDRILDLIPTNEDNEEPTQRSSSRSCHIDENGSCRRTLGIKKLRQRGEFEDFVDWLGSFKKRTAVDDSGKCVTNNGPFFDTGPLCENDTLPWVDGNCYHLNSQGPCNDQSWLVLKGVLGDRAVMTCQVRRCEEQEVWWPETCSCVALGTLEVCDQAKAVAIGPYGEGICASTLGDRILDLIPTNEDDESDKVATQRRSRTRSCHIDENGRCRRTLKIRNLRRRGGFEEWLGEFTQRTTTDESGVCIPALQCEGDSLPWNDGNCYQLASRGPCDVGSWLILEEIVDGEKPVMKCQKQRCEDTGVWWPETCSCVGRGRSDVCGDGQGIAVGPYGEGVCANMLGDRILDLIPTNEDNEEPTQRSSSRSCHIDENGSCRRTLGLKKLRQRGEFEDFVDWLSSFRKRTAVDESGKCVTNNGPFFDSGPLCDNDTLPWVDGNCYHLNSQGPCNDQSWLVLKGVLGDRAVMTCQVRRCEEQDVWWPETCSCIKLGTLKVCDQDKAVSVGPYGEGICASTLGDRILDLIPTNEEDEPRQRSCHVDQSGTCRRILRIKTLRERGEFETFVDWLSAFSQRTKVNQLGECLLHTE
jgi:diphthamide synthase (EF-2-diphthine--ammonia ligase)